MEHMMVSMELEETKSYMHVLLNNAMMGYFIDCCPMLPIIKRWA